MKFLNFKDIGDRAEKLCDRYNLGADELTKARNHVLKVRVVEIALAGLVLAFAPWPWALAGALVTAISFYRVAATLINSVTNNLRRDYRVARVAAAPKEGELLAQLAVR